jgi:ribosome biogenesis GTPase
MSRDRSVPRARGPAPAHPFTPSSHDTPGERLAAWGWDARWQRSLEDLTARRPRGGDEPREGGSASAAAGAELEPGRVVTASRDTLRVATAAGEEDAWVPGRLVHQAATPADLPCAGDWLALRRLGAGEPLLVEAVLPRRTLFVRRAAGRATAPHALAANVDLALLVSSLAGEWSPRRLERWLALAREAGSEVAVVLTKADLCDDPATIATAAAAVAGGAPVRVVSAVAPGAGGERHEERGADDPLVALAELLAPGRTVALLGSSGVGKSTLANRLAGRELAATAEVAGDGRGRHTTTRRELLRLPSGTLLLDTPGLREVGVWLGEEPLAALFPEIEEAARRCRFRDCTHGDEPGCAVQDAVRRGAIDTGRLAGLHRLEAEQAALRRRTDEGAAREERRRWKAIHRANKRHRPRSL